MKLDITSLQNPRVKNVIRLREDRRQRQRDGMFLVEGGEEIAFALASGIQPRTLFTAPELAIGQIGGITAETITVNRVVFEKMSYRERPDGWLAVYPIPQRSLAETRLGDRPLVILAESVEKPGNLGAILRTADAAAVDALLVCDPRVDLWNPNVVRASRGAVFTVPAVECDNASAWEWIRVRGLRIVAAVPSADMPYTDVDLREPTALAVGTEDKGLTEFWMSRADVKVKIPMMGKVNALNVSIAAALIIYEAVRQRTGQEITFKSSYSDTSG